MQFHPEWGRSISPVTSSDTDLAGPAGRARFATTPRTRLRQGLSAERIAEVRARVQGGYYNSAAMMDELAQRLMSSGAL